MKTDSELREEAKRLAEEKRKKEYESDLAESKKLGFSGLELKQNVES